MPTVPTRVGRLVVMRDAERVERIRSLAESLSADEAERDLLKRRADESLALLHDAVRELVESTHRESDAVRRVVPARS
jgi:hypothetical protein